MKPIHNRYVYDCTARFDKFAHNIH